MISILMSCYNSNLDYLKAQIDSIVNQTEKDWQLLIYNDNFDGKERDKLRTFILGLNDTRIWWVTGKHLGYAKAYNLLLKEAEGEYICFCDHDDIWEPDKLEISKKYLDEHPEVDATFGLLHWFGEKDKVELMKITDEDITKELLFWQPIKQPTVMFRKSRFGNFDSPYDCAGDYWFWSNHFNRHYHLIEKIMVHYRRHPGEATKNKILFRENTAKIIQENLLKFFNKDLSLDICRSLDRYSKTYNEQLKKEIQNEILKEKEKFNFTFFKK